MAVKPRIQQGGGLYLPRRATTQQGGSEYHARGAVEQRGGGMYAAAMAQPGPPYLIEQRAGGEYHARTGREQHGGGRYNVLSITIEQRGGGLYRVNRAVNQRGGGQYTAYATIEQRGGGPYRADWDGAWHELFVNEGSPPDLEADSPAATSSTLPFNYTFPAAAGAYYVKYRVRNKHFAEPNVHCWVYVIDAGLNFVNEPPTAPEGPELVAGVAGAITLHAWYLPGADAVPADTWVAYIRSDGTDPDPDLDTPETWSTVSAGGVAYLNETETGYGDDADVRAIIRTKRAADGLESDNENVVTATAKTAGPAATTVSAFHQVAAEWIEA